MEFEDSRCALYCDPNAYIKKFNKTEIKHKERKKIVFQEPYETLPQFYINNNFTKHDCDCVKNKNNNLFKDKHDYDCNHANKNCDFNYRNDNCYNDKNNNKGFGFDLKNLLPLLGNFNKGGGANLSQLAGFLNNTSNSQNGNSSNPMNMISSILSNKDAMSGILNIFKGVGSNFNKSKPIKKSYLSVRAILVVRRWRKRFCALKSKRLV